MATRIDPEDESNESQPSFDPSDLIKRIAASAKSSFKQPEPGVYSAIVAKVEPVQFESGLALRMSYVLDYHNVDEDRPLFKDSQIFRMTKQDNRTPDEWGPDFYNRAMAKLGFDQKNRGKEAWEQIEEQKPGIALKIVAAKDPEYRNRTIIGLLDDDDEGISFIREQLDSHPF